MSNVFANLPPIINATGASVDTSAFGFERTVTVTGVWSGLVIVEASVGGAFVPVATFQTPGTKLVKVAASAMRARSSGASAGGVFTPNIDVGSDAVGVRFGVIPAPLVNAVGAALDISEFGERTSIIVDGAFVGSIVIEISEDGTGYVEAARCSQPGVVITKSVTANFIRARSIDSTGVITPALTIGSVNDPLPAVPAESFAITGRDDGVSFDVYVNGTTGDDANDGLTAATALATIAEVRRKFPFYLFGPGTRCIVHLLNDSVAAVLDYTEPSLHLGGGDLASDQSYVYRGPQMIPLPDIASGPTTAALDVAPYRVDTTGAASGTGRRERFDFTGAAPGWTPGDLVGSFVRATRGGLLVTYEFPIAENGADYFIVDSHVETFYILATDTIEVVTPAVRVVAPPDAFGNTIMALWGKAAGFSQFIYPAPDDNTEPLTFERISFDTVQATGIHGLAFDRCRFVGQFGLRLLAGSCSFSNCASNVEVQLGGHSGYQAFFRADDPGVNPIISDFAQSGQIALTIATRAGGFPQNGLSIGRCRTTQVIQPSSFLFERNVSIYGSTNSGVNCYAGSTVAFSAGLLGANNTVVGARAHQNSQIYFYTSVANAPVRMTITGTGGALQVGNGAAIAYGAGAGQFQEVGGYEGNFTRKNDGTAAAPVGDASLIAIDANGGV